MTASPASFPDLDLTLCPLRFTFQNAPAAFFSGPSSDRWGGAGVFSLSWPAAAAAARALSFFRPSIRSPGVPERPLNKNWTRHAAVLAAATPILVLAGHADSRPWRELHHPRRGRRHPLAPAADESRPSRDELPTEPTDR